MLRRWIGLLTVVITGCIPYAFPSLEMTPPVEIPTAKDEVHAFRVDVATMSGRPCYGAESFSLREIPLVEGRVPPQIQAGLDNGIIIIGVALNYHFHYHDGVEVRLYRPGCQLVHFKAWQPGKPLDWRPAKHFTDREDAIDSLLARTGAVDWCSVDVSDAENKKEWVPPRGLRAGSHSAAHFEALQFAAQEYQRLASARDADCTDAVKRRLLEKAEKVQALAKKTD